jgi:hypothetical protein
MDVMVRVQVGRAASEKLGEASQLHVEHHAAGIGVGHVGDRLPLLVHEGDV